LVCAPPRDEVPDPGLAFARQQAPARELVARPLADDGPGQIADVVLVEDEDRAEARPRQRLARPAQPIGVQTPEVPALLEIGLRVAGRLKRPVPTVARIHVIGGHGPGLRHVLLPGHGGASFCRHASADGSPAPRRPAARTTGRYFTPACVRILAHGPRTPAPNSDHARVP